MRNSLLSEQSVFDARQRELELKFSIDGCPGEADDQRRADYRNYLSEISVRQPSLFRPVAQEQARV